MNYMIIINMNVKDLKILYFGTPEMSANVLERLIEDGFNIIGLVAQADKPVGRKKELKPVPTKNIAQKHNVPVFQPYRLKNDFRFIQEVNPDLILSFAYGQIVPHEVLMMPKYGCLNLHGSLLPKYRGAAPIQFSILNGDKVSGVTLMEMIDKMDAGRMYLKETFNIEENDNYSSLINKISLAAYNVFINGIEDYINKENLGEEQDESLVTFTHKITNDDLKIDFRKKSESIKNQVRAFSMIPGVFFLYKNELIKIYEIEILSSSIGIPGEILDYSKKCLKISTSDKTISVLKLQRPGKKIMGISEFFNGNQAFFEIGDIIK